MNIPLTGPTAAYINLFHSTQTSKESKMTVYFYIGPFVSLKRQAEKYCSLICCERKTLQAGEHDLFCTAPDKALFGICIRPVWYPIRGFETAIREISGVVYFPMFSLTESRE